MDELKQAQFNGWARVEVMGHQTHIGFVRTEAYGQAVMFRIDTPERPEREYILEEPAYCEGRWTPQGAKVRRAACPGLSVLVGAGSIYRIVPCSEAAALKAIESSQRAELKLIELPPEKALAAAADEENGDEQEDDEEEYPPDEDEEFEQEEQSL